MKIQNALVSNIFDRSQRYFAHVTTVTLSWRVQNIVVIGRVYFTLECFGFSSNFEFDRNMFSGTGAWCLFGVRAFATIMMTKIGRRASGMLNVMAVKSDSGDTDFNSMGHCKKDVTPLLTHWSCVFLALIHRIGYANFCSISKFPLLFSIRRAREGSIFICQLNAN